MDWKKVDKKIIALAVVIVAFVAFGIAIGPRITGYSVLENEKTQLETQQKEYETMVESYQTNLTQLANDLNFVNRSLASCQENNEKTYSKLETYMNKTMECERKLGDVEEQCETEKGKIQKSLDECEADFEEKSHQYNEMVNYAGTKICCIMKIYNPNIGSFDIDLEKYEIKCREGTDGQIRIYCQV